MSFTLTDHLGPVDAGAALRADVRAGLTATPKTLPPTWFYDARGSELFDEITRLPEYYPTRAERAILVEHADEVAVLSGADTLVELGSGTSEKTQLLLESLTTAGTLRRFVPFDVDASVLQHAGRVIGERFPDLAVDAAVGDFTQHLGKLPREGTRLVAFLGSTIGNLEPAARASFLADVGAMLDPGDWFLLGTDLVKDTGRLVAAYDDAAGVTAAFNENVLVVVNRELDADADLTAFEHVALWDAENSWIEMRLRSTRDQVVRIGALDLEVAFAAGEDLRTEVSTKFTVEGVAAELAAAGLRVAECWTDPDGDFALTLATPF